MKSLIQMTIAEFKLFLREPASVFFTLAFPLVLLFIFGAIFGNEPSEMFGGLGSVDVSVPAYVGLMIGTLGLISLPVGLASYRESGVLRRFRATPAQPWVIFGAMLIVNLLAALLGTGLLLIAGKLVFNLRMPEAPIQLFFGILLGIVSFSAVSFVLAGLVPTTRSAQAVGMALLMPMIFLSGAAMPRETLPDNIRRIGEFLPLTQVVILLEDLWFTRSWNMIALLALLAMMVIGVVLATRLFRWE
ncbi:MAG: ABC transporter permease [Anaerolineales bacterium]|nr:ABC transporter permease [Anaerolineales bacterium]MCB9128074.1 ABC transporter permease [Ardenticatenales bacterium]